MSASDDAELLDAFLTEAGELVEQLGDQLMALESDPRDHDTLNAVFRTFHTVKGGAGFLSIKPLVELCHTAENLLNQARNAKFVLSPEQIEQLFKTSDVVTAMLDAVRAGQPAEPAPADLLAGLELPSAEAAPSPAAPPIASETTPPLPSSPAPADIVAAPSASATATTESGSISDDEFEALLDQLYGTGHAPGSTEPDLQAVAESAASAAPAPVAPSADKTAPSMTPAAADPAAPVAPVPAPVPVARPATADTAAAKPAAAVEHTIRIDTARLDSLINQAGELVLVRNRLANTASHIHDTTLERVVNEFDRVLNALQGSVMLLRMQPVSRLFQRVPRQLRDLSHQLGKQVRLQVEGEETNLDRSLVDALADPLVHLLRNAVDHGIETPEVRAAAGKPPEGTIELSAGQQGERIVITIRDDGKGMDPELLRRKAVEKGVVDADRAARLSEQECYELVFQAGFSTRDTVSEVSGRGVGMDVVKTRIIELGGTLAIHSELGVGTRITLSLPLTLAILQVMMVQIGSRLLALTLSNVSEVFELDPEQVSMLDGRAVIANHGTALPLCDLSDWLETGSGQELLTTVVVVQIAHQRLGVMVDRVLGREEVMIKPLSGPLRQLAGLAGATITGDGRIALVLDIGNIANHHLHHVPPYKVKH
ncbi:chemotaxis protein CheA [Frateuria aurantia]|uniref:Chemotaxis protein CheA n=1 Tax=Frateuria aurantia (strain ATCC 33424 / DSM 6220 / KCTC 2777 / LMG 1558 / NBRC 3245 / NCIMB 13370) TaxID=767434 RepID=H8L3G0_FRAAD|nr:chemotaxis protein CheA [Frateuria aurantia]AFC86482.1 chemotaxis protein histidine kinase-like protein [Frateuria aurantia DSM 6220]